MIYFIQFGEGGPIKIGTSINVPLRLMQLQSHYTEDFTLLSTIEGGPIEEAKLHQRFSHLRYGHTEQFRPSEELIDFIGCGSQSRSNPHDVPSVKAKRKPMRCDLSDSEWKQVRVAVARSGLTTRVWLEKVLMAQVAREEQQAKESKP